MTAKDKVLLACQFAQRVKLIANRLKMEASDYDCKWPNAYINDLITSSDKLLLSIAPKH